MIILFSVAIFFFKRKVEEEKKSFFIPESEVELEELLGEGNFGAVNIYHQIIVIFVEEVLLLNLLWSDFIRTLFKGLS